MARLSFEIPGEPCAQGRPRFTMISGHPKAYDPAKSRNYKAFVKMVATQEAEKQGWRYTELPLDIHIMAYFPVPASKSKKFKLAAYQGLEVPAKKPDIDNLFKTITDAMSGAIYKDDKQLVTAIISKHYVRGENEQPRVEVEINLA